MLTEPWFPVEKLRLHDVAVKRVRKKNFALGAARDLRIAAKVEFALGAVRVAWPITGGIARTVNPRSKNLRNIASLIVYFVVNVESDAKVFLYQ